MRPARPPTKAQGLSACSANAQRVDGHVNTDEGRRATVSPPRCHPQGASGFPFGGWACSTLPSASPLSALRSGRSEDSCLAGAAWRTCLETDVSAWLSLGFHGEAGSHQALGFGIGQTRPGTPARCLTLEKLCNFVGTQSAYT